MYRHCVNLEIICTCRAIHRSPYTRAREIMSTYRHRKSLFSKLSRHRNQIHADSNDRQNCVDVHITNYTSVVPVAVVRGPVAFSAAIDVNLKMAS